MERAHPFVMHTGPLSPSDAVRSWCALPMERQMHSVFYIIGVVVVVIAVLSLAGVV